jgi:hypothetical protein
VARNPAQPASTAEEEVEVDVVDEALEETFPASDPGASWAGPDWDHREGDESNR